VKRWVQSSVSGRRRYQRAPPIRTTHGHGDTRTVRASDFVIRARMHAVAVSRAGVTSNKTLPRHTAYRLQPPAVVAAGNDYYSTMSCSCTARPRQTEVADCTVVTVKQLANPTMTSSVKSARSVGFWYSLIDGPLTRLHCSSYDFCIVK